MEIIENNINERYAYGVIGQSLLTKLMPLCPAKAVHKYYIYYTLLYLITFLYMFYKGSNKKCLKNKALILILSLLCIFKE